MLGVALDARDTRVLLWAELLESGDLSTDEIDRELLQLARGSSTDEKEAFVLLRAAAQLFDSGSDALRRSLRIAIVYWFSQVGSLDEEAEPETLDLANLSDLQGTHLTWSECARRLGGNPSDYSAYSRTIQKLKDEVLTQWNGLFGEGLPFGEAQGV